ncbi:hypothetical protein BU16DRAFT_563174 [Lophium mytilinum]|uniref:Uncharacterized protein n=1 Tax=Lophium mytilinum TaxID=390894 RepID=A0A6A6QQ18_9PEZI|nr:hypothetical protein BU16DRAFT_563174 [Lophium mytilinum]
MAPALPNLDLDFIQRCLSLEEHLSASQIPEPWVLRGQLLHAILEYAIRLATSYSFRTVEGSTLLTYTNTARTDLLQDFRGIAPFFPTTNDLEPFTRSLQDRVQVIHQRVEYEGRPGCHFILEVSILTRPNILARAMSYMLQLESGQDFGELDPEIWTAEDAGLHNHLAVDYGLEYGENSWSPQEAAEGFNKLYATVQLATSVYVAADPVPAAGCENEKVNAIQLHALIVEPRYSISGQCLVVALTNPNNQRAAAQASD